MGMSASLWGTSRPTASHNASQASPSAPTTRSTEAGPNAAAMEGSTSMAAAEPRYIPLGFGLERVMMWGVRLVV